MDEDTQRYLFVKDAVNSLIKRTNEELDICELYPNTVGIGYNELRYIGINDEGQVTFESNNVHDWERGDDCYMVFYWADLSDYEKDMLCYLLSEEQIRNDSQLCLILQNA